MYLQRVGWFGDAAFYEVFSDFMQAEAALRESRRRVRALEKQCEALEHRLAASDNELHGLRLQLRFLSNPDDDGVAIPAKRA